MLIRSCHRVDDAKQNGASDAIGEGASQPKKMIKKKKKPAPVEPEPEPAKEPELESDEESENENDNENSDEDNEDQGNQQHGDSGNEDDENSEEEDDETDEEEPTADQKHENGHEVNSLMSCAYVFIKLILFRLMKKSTINLDLKAKMRAKMKVVTIRKMTGARRKNLTTIFRMAHLWTRYKMRQRKQKTPRKTFPTKAKTSPARPRMPLMMSQNRLKTFLRKLRTHQSRLKILLLGLKRLSRKRCLNPPKMRLTMLNQRPRMLQNLSRKQQKTQLVLPTRPKMRQADSPVVFQVKTPWVVAAAKTKGLSLK